jgi:GMP synthase-like glutamine amidotransferase
MKLVLIFRHIDCEGPGYLASFLTRHNIQFSVIDLYKGVEIPRKISTYAGLVFMGGPMSVNDNLPWITVEQELIRQAYEHNIPMLGHCLGAQLISKALGGDVMKNAVSEIGWFPVAPVENHIQVWTQDLSFNTEMFHWHNETFVPPPQSVPLFMSEHCANQGFMLENIIALQFHVEMQGQDIAEWLTVYADDIPPLCKSVQDSKEILSNLEYRIPRLHEFADRIYRQWLNSLKND